MAHESDILKPDDPAYAEGDAKHAVRVAEMAAYKWVLDMPAELDPVCGDDGYPTEIELQRIEHWFDESSTNWNERLLGLITYVRERWNYREWGWHETTDKDGTTFYAISTGGWSGNESLMSSMEKNWVFWSLMFESHRVGGHYILKLKPIKETHATT